jgi:hypothetical protein
MLYLRYVLNSNLGLETGFSDWRFRVLFPDTRSWDTNINFPRNFAVHYEPHHRSPNYSTWHSRRRLQPSPPVHTPSVVCAACSTVLFAWRRWFVHSCVQTRGGRGLINILEPMPLSTDCTNMTQERYVRENIMERYCPFRNLGRSRAHFAKSIPCILIVDLRILLQSLPPALHITTEIIGSVLT